jgi:hypothetical protein
MMNSGINNLGILPVIILSHLLTITTQGRDSEITIQSPQKIMMTLTIISEAWVEASRA